jgi:hypothetical protein
MERGEMAGTMIMGMLCCDAMRCDVLLCVVRCVNETMMVLLSVCVANEAGKPRPYVFLSIYQW